MFWPILKSINAYKLLSCQRVIRPCTSKTTMYYCWYYAEESRDIGQIILTCQFSKARQQGVEAYKVHCMNYTPQPHPDDKKIYNGTVDLLTLVKTLNK